MQWSRSILWLHHAILAYTDTVRNTKIKTVTKMKKYHVKLLKFIELLDVILVGILKTVLGI